MHTVFALLCFVVVIHWLIFPCPPGLLHWHCGNLTIAPVPAKQPWWIWINTSCEFIMNDCMTTTKQSTTKPCAYFLGYTVYATLALVMLVPWQAYHICKKSDPKYCVYISKQTIHMNNHSFSEYISGDLTIIFDFTAFTSVKIHCPPPPPPPCKWMKCFSWHARQSFDQLTTWQFTRYLVTCATLYWCSL